MSDDGFVFGDDGDGDESNDRALFGTRSADDTNRDTEPGERLGASGTDGTRWETVLPGALPTAATVGVAVVLLVAAGVVAYPLVMGTLDANEDSTGGTLTTAGGDIESPGSTVATPTAPESRTAIRETVGATDTRTSDPTAASAATTAPASTVPESTTRTTATPTATPAGTPTTPVPTRGFPAGNPDDETAEGG